MINDKLNHSTALENSESLIGTNTVMVILTIISIAQ